MILEDECNSVKWSPFGNVSLTSANKEAMSIEIVDDNAKSHWTQRVAVQGPSTSSTHSSRWASCTSADDDSDSDEGTFGEFSGIPGSPPPILPLRKRSLNSEEPANPPSPDQGLQLPKRMISPKPMDELRIAEGGTVESTRTVQQEFEEEKEEQEQLDLSAPPCKNNLRNHRDSLALLGHGSVPFARSQKGLGLTPPVRKRSLETVEGEEEDCNEKLERLYEERHPYQKTRNMDYSSLIDDVLLTVEAGEAMQ